MTTELTIIIDIIAKKSSTLQAISFYWKGMLSSITIEELINQYGFEKEKEI